jgi:peptidoglycan hydrolase-like protein with peptidoglycan-binding domain
LRTLFVISLGALFAAWGLGAQDPASAPKKTTASKTSPSKTSAGKSSAKATTSVKSTPKTTVAATHATTGKAAPKPAYHRASGASPTGSKPGTVAARRPAAPPPYRQQAPTPQRYKEIQQALADKGYFSGPVDGTWGAGSVDALKRFQHDENITEDGKIGSLSLIALGLGPRRAPPSEAALDKPVQE